jgi:hypothetical protein
MLTNNTKINTPMMKSIENIKEKNITLKNKNK